MAAVAAVCACLGLTTSDTQAQTRAQHIEKVANKRLQGAAYARLPGLTWDQCVARCLADPQCSAIEFYRGGGVVFGRNPRCRMFKVVGEVRDSKYADIGFKRPGPGQGAPVTAQPSDDPALRKGQAPPAAKKAPPRRAEKDVDDRKVLEQPREPVAGAPPPSPVPQPAPRVEPKPNDPPGRPRSIVKAEEKGPAGGQPPRTDYHVVPVYYGTDRNRRDIPGKRIGYGADRASRLEMGQALVTVPKLHEVPKVERPWKVTIPYTSVVLYEEKEDPARHFTIQDLSAMSRAELLAKIRARLGASSTYRNQALVLVHGYNNGFDDALYRTAQITYDLGFDGASFLYSWPSGSGLAKYLYDRDSAQQAEPFLTEFLEMVLNETGADNVNLVAHSMGNQLLLPVLRRIKERNPAVAGKINQIILAAPDVDRTTFAFLAGEIRGVGRGITLYASSNDVALQTARRFAGGVPRAGEIADGFGPTIVPDVDTIDVTALGTDYLGTNHSTYAERTALLRDIELLFKSGQRPPEKRFPLLQLVPTDKGNYWKFP